MARTASLSLPRSAAPAAPACTSRPGGPKRSTTSRAIGTACSRVVLPNTTLTPRISISGEWKAPLLSVAREEGFPVVDLDPTLDSGAGIEGHFFEADPLHWSPAGHAVVGEALVPMIEELVGER